MKRRLLLSLAALILFAGFGHAAFADSLTVAFSNANQSTLPGNTLTYSAILTNTTSSTLFLNGDYFTFTSPFTPDDTPFFNNAPISLGPGQSSLLIAVFNVVIPSGSNLGYYTGNYTIIGGADGNALNNIGTASFSMTVTPEPSTWLLMTTGLVGIFVLTRRTRVQQAIRTTLS